MATLPEKVKAEDEEQAYKIYMTDCIRIFARVETRYADLINQKTVKPVKPGEAKKSICNKLRER